MPDAAQQSTQMQATMLQQPPRSARVGGLVVDCVLRRVGAAPKQDKVMVVAARHLRTRRVRAVFAACVAWC